MTVSQCQKDTEMVLFNRVVLIEKNIKMSSLNIICSKTKYSSVYHCLYYLMRQRCCAIDGTKDWAQNLRFLFKDCRRHKKANKLLQFAETNGKLQGKVQLKIQIV